MRRPENQEYLTQMVLRPYLATNFELKSPEVTDLARRVARDLGILEAIRQWWISTRARAERPDVDFLADDYESPWINGFIFMAFIYFIGMVIGWYFRAWWYKSEPKGRRTISVQSQTTYTRGATNPRFKPLADEAHGAYVQ